VLHLGAVLGVAGTAASFLPVIGFGTQPGTSDEVRTIRGRLEPGAPDWVYLPVNVPRRVREIEVVYRYDRPPVPPAAPGNALDIGIFGTSGHQLGNHRGFRGWSGGFRDRFAISAGAATPGYLPGPIDSGTWHVILGPYTIAPQGMNYEVDVTLRYGPPGRPFQPTPAPERAIGRGRCWYRGDAHLHTVHSDGARTPSELAAQARQARLDFVVSTEHNTPSASLIWGQHAGPDLLIVDGEEVTTRSGHWLALGLADGEWIDWRYRAEEPAEFRRFADQVHRRGGLVVAAHPFCPFVGCPWEFGYDLPDAIEVWNGPWSADDEESVQTWDHLLRHGRWLPAVGNSDAHREPQVVGLPQTAVLAEELTTDAVLDGLRAGRCYLAESADRELSMTATDQRATAGIGDRLAVGPDQKVDVEVTATGVTGCTVRLIGAHGTVAVAAAAPDGSATLRATTRPRDTGYLRAEVRHPLPTATTPDSMVAMSNPVFLGAR
jgi:hypothetical protein